MDLPLQCFPCIVHPAEGAGYSHSQLTVLEKEDLFNDDRPHVQHSFWFSFPLESILSHRWHLKVVHCPSFLALVRPQPTILSNWKFQTICFDLRNFADLCYPMLFSSIQYLFSIFSFQGCNFSGQKRGPSILAPPNGNTAWNVKGTLGRSHQKWLAVNVKISHGKLNRNYPQSQWIIMLSIEIANWAAISHFQTHMIDIGSPCRFPGLGFKQLLARLAGEAERDGRMLSHLCIENSTSESVGKNKIPMKCWTKWRNIIQWYLILPDPSLFRLFAAQLRRIKAKLLPSLPEPSVTCMDKKWKQLRHLARRIPKFKAWTNYPLVI